MEATMRKLKILMITSILIIAVASPIFAKDIVTGPDNGGYCSTNAHRGQGQQLGGKSGEKSQRKSGKKSGTGLENASRHSDAIGQNNKTEK
jgi:hypothetical protein